jgi:hypothetical protein
MPDAPAAAYLLAVKRRPKEIMEAVCAAMRGTAHHHHHYCLRCPTGKSRHRSVESPAQK